MPLVVKVLYVDLASSFQIFIRQERGPRSFRGHNQAKESDSHLTLLLLFLLPPFVFLKGYFRVLPFFWACSPLTLLVVLLGLSVLTPYPG